MPKYSSHLLIAQLQQQTTTILELAINQWQMIPHHVFARKPNNGGWSANECLQHLNAYGDYYLPVIEKAMAGQIQEQQINAIFKAGVLGNYFTKLMTPCDGTKPMKKMKAPKDKTPQSIVESHLVVSTFIDQQEQLLQLLEKARMCNLNNVYIPISISRFIRLKLGDTFQFLVMHNLRHVLQAQRALGNENISTIFITPTQYASL